MIPTPVLVTFAVVIAIVFLVFWVLMLRPEQEEQAQIRRRLKVGARAKVGGSSASVIRGETPLSTVPVFNSVLKAAQGVSTPTQALIDRAGLTMSVGSLILACLVTAAVAFMVVRMVTGLVLLSLVVGVLLAFLPIWIVRLKGDRRVLRFEEQFPEAIDLLSRALKAGHAFTTGLSMVAEEMPDPVGTEFRLAYDRQNFGMPLPDALRGLAQRVPLLDAKFFVTAVLTQRDAGGNLSEVLDNLASVIRERFKVKRQVRVVTAHARLTGWVLVLMPPVLGLVLTMLSPGHMRLLWTDPLGLQMVFVAVVLQVVGSLVIRRLVNIEY